MRRKRQKATGHSKAAKLLPGLSTAALMLGLALPACTAEHQTIQVNPSASIPAVPFTMNGPWIEDIAAPLAPGEFVPLDTAACGPTGNGICWDGCAARLRPGMRIIHVGCQYRLDGTEWIRYCSCLFAPATWTSDCYYDALRGCRRGPTLLGPM